MATSSSSSNLRGLMLLLLTSGFFIIGLLFDYMPMIVDNQIKRQVELATNEEIRGIWSNPPIDINSYYWLYAVENAEQFMLGEKARVRRVGPYHFTSRIEKKIIELSANKYRLFYNSTRHIKLNESAENPDLDTKLNFINPIYGSVLEGVREFAATSGDPQMRTMIYASSMRLTEKYNESLIMNTTARVALVGRRVEFLERAKKMAETFGLDKNLPKTLPGGLFGYVAVANGTWSGPYEIYTGYQASMPSLGDIISYQGKRRLTEFQGRCNRLQASAGEMRPMPIGNNQILEMFQPSFCRIIHLQPTGVKKLREGLAISYVVAPEDFMGAESNPDNRCFCVNGTVDNYCSLNGVIELAPCNYYSPLIVTANNMQIDSRITNSIHDWNPELINSDMDLLPPVDNSSQIVILKRIGVPLKADITLILFMKIIRDSRFKQTSTVPEVSYIPLLMVRDQAVIPPALGQIIVNVESFLALTYHIKVVMYLSALVLLGWLTGHYYNKSTKDRVVPSSNGSGPGGGGGGRRSSGDGGASISPSEWANSADSSKSQRPSRFSQSSMDPNCEISASPPTTQTSGGQQQQQQQRQSIRRQVAAVAAVAATIRPETRDPGMMAGAEATPGHQLGSPQRTGSLPLSQFGKLDGQELLVVMAAGDGAKGEQQQQQSQKKQPDSSDAGPAEPSGAEVDQPQHEEFDHEHDDGGEGGGASEAATTNRGHKKNWFMKVCSNFVRMLNGIRTTINDAGQLDIIENDYQDKQLELLAGKIDNWQRYSIDGGAGSGITNVESNEEQAAAASLGGQHMNNMDGGGHNGGASASKDHGGNGGGIEHEMGRTNGPSVEPSRATLEDELDHRKPPEAGGSRNLDGRQFQQQQQQQSLSSPATESPSASTGIIVNSSGGPGEVDGHSTVSAQDEIDRVGADAAVAAASVAARDQSSSDGQQQQQLELEQEVPVAEICPKPAPPPIIAACGGGGLDSKAATAAQPTSETDASTASSAKTGDTVRRADSAQSNLTIINRSDTSGDESICGDRDRDSGEVRADDDVGGLSEEDKARALEQMEMALSKKTEPLFSSPEPPATLASQAGAEVDFLHDGDEVGGRRLRRGLQKPLEEISPYESMSARAASYPDPTATSGEPTIANGTATTISNSNSFGLDSGGGGSSGGQQSQLGAIYGGGGGPKVASSPSSSSAVVMINSSTSMDSILDGSISFTSGSTNSFATTTANGGREDPSALMAAAAADRDQRRASGGAAGHLGHNQSVCQNDQIDESSSAAVALGQSNKLAAAAAGAGANGVASGGLPDNDDHEDEDDDDGVQPKGGGGAAEIVSSTFHGSGKDERRDSGVKLDSRNGAPGISGGGGGGGSDTMATIKPTVGGGDGGHTMGLTKTKLEKNNTTNGTDTIRQKNSNGRHISNNNSSSNNNTNNNNNSGSNNNIIIRPLAAQSSLPAATANRQQQIKGADTINGSHGFRNTKLFNGHTTGNNISNGNNKIMFQQRQATES